MGHSDRESINNGSKINFSEDYAVGLNIKFEISL